MGGILSRLLLLPQATDADRAEWERQRQWEAAHPPPPLVPPEADEGAGVFACFVESVQVVPHKNGTCLVAYAGHEDRDSLGEPNPYEVNARDVNEYLLHAVGVEDPEENGGQAHPRIVKYLGRLTPGFKLEFVSPGPLEAIRLPLFPVPVIGNSTSGLNSLTSHPPLLLLYHRWALQTLSALHFLHTHAVYLSNLCASSIWIRPDFSAALTGFISATLPTAEQPSAQAGYRSGEVYLDFREVEVEYDPETGSELEASPRGDICDWATIFWRLVTNRQSVHPPVGPGKVRWPMLFSSNNDKGDWPADWDRDLERERLKERQFQQLEEARMGDILVKAWGGEYRDVGEVKADLRALLEKMGVEVTGEDEILPGGGQTWEDIFVVIPPHDEEGYWREIRLRETGALDSSSRTTLIAHTEPE